MTLWRGIATRGRGRQTVKYHSSAGSDEERRGRRESAANDVSLEMGSMAGEGGFGTRCIHAGEAPDPTTGAHGVPLYQNVTFAFETNGQVEAMRSGERPHFTYS